MARALRPEAAPDVSDAGRDAFARTLAELRDTALELDGLPAVGVRRRGRGDRRAAERDRGAARRRDVDAAVPARGRRRGPGRRLRRALAALLAAARARRLRRAARRICSWSSAAARTRPRTSRWSCQRRRHRDLQRQRARARRRPPPARPRAHARARQAGRARARAAARPGREPQLQGRGSRQGTSLQRHLEREPAGVLRSSPRSPRTCPSACVGSFAYDRRLARRRDHRGDVDGRPRARARGPGASVGARRQRAPGGAARAVPPAARGGRRAARGRARARRAGGRRHRPRRAPAELLAADPRRPRRARRRASRRSASPRSSAARRSCACCSSTAPTPTTTPTTRSACGPVNAAARRARPRDDAAAAGGGRRSRTPASSGGFTPLHSAAHTDDVEMARLLLAHGADPSLAADDGRDSARIAADDGSSGRRLAARRLGSQGVDGAEVLVFLLVAVALLAGAGLRFNVPYPIVLVVGGLRARPRPRAAGRRSSTRTSCSSRSCRRCCTRRRSRRRRTSCAPTSCRSAVLAIGLVLVTVVAVAAVAHWVAGVPWAAGVRARCGARPDRPGVGGRDRAAPRRAAAQIETVLEGEALVNDGTGADRVQDRARGGRRRPLLGAGEVGEVRARRGRRDRDRPRGRAGCSRTCGSPRASRRSTSCSPS